jgi:N-acetylneuraminic acid mutarotase
MDISSDSGRWVKVADLPEPRLHLSGTVIGGQIYAIGGQFRHDHNPIDVAYLHVYDWDTDSWQRKADLLFPRSHFEPGTMIINGQIVIAGGRANQSGFGNGQLRQVTVYDPQTDTWRELRELPVRLIAPAAARIGNKVIVTAGGTNWNTLQRNTYISLFTCQ